MNLSMPSRIGPRNHMWSVDVARYSHPTRTFAPLRSGVWWSLYPPPCPPAPLPELELDELPDVEPPLEVASQPAAIRDKLAKTAE